MTRSAASSAASPALASALDQAVAEVRDHIEDALDQPCLDAEAYFRDQLPLARPLRWTAHAPQETEARFHQRLTEVYLRFMKDNPEAWFIGEDIADPYGGAFKISQGMTSQFPERSLTTPISEAGIVGLGAGLALMGNRPLVEVMFGDFMTLAADQVVNNASKFFNMYNQKMSCPVIVRTPMGGRRGYGPTHSQSLERMFVGIDNCLALSLNSLTDPAVQLAALGSQRAPTLIFENKVDYTLRPFVAPRWVPAGRRRGRVSDRARAPGGGRADRHDLLLRWHGPAGGRGPRAPVHRRGRAGRADRPHLAASARRRPTAGLGR